MSKPIRLVIPVPDGGWLSIHERRTSDLINDWIDATVASVEAAQIPALGAVAIRAKVRLSTVPIPGRRRIFVAEDARPSLTSVLTGLVAAEVLKGSEKKYVVASLMSMGAHTGESGGLLVLELTEVSGG
jgi:hypothetical protein